MKVATGKVVGGKVVLEGVALEEGATVTVLANDDDGGFDLTPDQERELLLSIAEADQGEMVSAEEVLAKLADDTAREPWTSASPSAHKPILTAPLRGGINIAISRQRRSTMISRRAFLSSAAIL